jgi:hypothetical protein
MGFRPERRIFVLEFAEGHEYHGFEARMGSISFGKMMELETMTPELVKQDPEKAKQVYQDFANCIISWNLEDDDGNPIEPSMKALQAEDFDFVMALFTHWMEGVAAVAPPLPGSSASGSTSPVAQLPMETSESRAS